MIKELPFTTLEPYMSNEQLYIHYEKHHKTYDNNVKTILQSNVYDLDTILKTAEKNSKLYNNAAQVYNHNLFWYSMKLHTLTPDKRDKHINLIETIKTKSMDIFGSGWLFILDDLSVITTSNAEIPSGNHLLCLDIWEHTYYLDYKYDRKTFVEMFIFNLMNWDLIPN